MKDSGDSFDKQKNAISEKQRSYSSDEKKEFSENPYNSDKHKPSDLVRLFYSYDIPIIPVVSNRGILLGVISKDDVVAELSDIQRSENVKIDQFIKQVTKKISLDEALEYGTFREFVIINIFGEIKGKWSRIQLFIALEGVPREHEYNNSGIAQQQEDQVLEWVIYLILEHIPRPLYAVNDQDKTIFYNSHFEDLYTGIFKKDVDTRKVERSLKNEKKNVLLADNKNKDLYYLNDELGIFYEKIPMMNKAKRVGYLFFCNKQHETPFGPNLSDLDIDKLGLGDIIEKYERNVLIDFLSKTEYDISKTAKLLKIGKKTLLNKFEKYDIKQTTQKK